jgi:hypothetical protein
MMIAQIERAIPRRQSNWCSVTVSLNLAFRRMQAILGLSPSTVIRRRDRSGLITANVADGILYIANRF